MIDGKRSTVEVETWDLDQLDAFLAVLDMRADLQAALGEFKRKESEPK